MSANATPTSLSSPEDLPGEHGTYVMYRKERRLFGASCAACRIANSAMASRYRKANGMHPKVTKSA